MVAFSADEDGGLTLFQNAVILYSAFNSIHFEDDIYSSRRMRGIIMQVLLQIVAFSLQT